MDGIDFIIRLGKAANEMRSPMTIEEALDIVDPSKMVEPPEDPDLAMAKEIKAMAMVVKFARGKLKDEQSSIGTVGMHTVRCMNCGELIETAIVTKCTVVKCPKCGKENAVVVFASDEWSNVVGEELHG